MKILAIECSAVSASVALSEEDLLISESFVNIKQTHSETLMPMAGELLRRCGTGLDQIGLLAVSVGPGSFTGVRIGVAAVKGMALPNSIPCAAVSSLEAAAQNIAYFDGIICAVMDARRAQVYNALFTCEGGVITRLCDDRAIEIATLKNELTTTQKKAIFVGDGAKLCYNSLKEVCDVMLPPEALICQRAGGVAAVGYRQYLLGNTLSAADLQPFYLRLPQAERELRAKGNLI